jgi:hypothetical protein
MCLRAPGFPSRIRRPAPLSAETLRNIARREWHGLLNDTGEATVPLTSG